MSDLKAQARQWLEDNELAVNDELVGSLRCLLEMVAREAKQEDERCSLPS